MAMPRAKVAMDAPIRVALPPLSLMKARTFNKDRQRRHTTSRQNPFARTFYFFIEYTAARARQLSRTDSVECGPAAAFPVYFSIHAAWPSEGQFAIPLEKLRRFQLSDRARACTRRRSAAQSTKFC